MLYVEVVRLKDCVGISEKGFMHPLHCRDVPPCRVIRQEQFFFRQQNFYSFSLEHKHLHGNL